MGALADAQLLEANPNLLGLGQYWEPNAFDGKDSDFVNQPNHDATGRYLTYWNRASGTIKSEPLTGDAPENADNQYYYRPASLIASSVMAGVMCCNPCASARPRTVGR